MTSASAHPPVAATPVVVLGIGADGWTGLTEAERFLVRQAHVLLGGDRHLGLVPEVPGQLRLPWPSPLRPGLVPLMAELAGRSVVALASGDPLVSGIGTVLVEVLGPDRVVLLPHVSSVTLARARLGWSAESVTVVSTVGRDAAAVRRPLSPGRRLVILSSDEHTPAQVAAIVTDSGYGASPMTVFGDLGAPHESRAHGSAADWSGASPRLNVIAVECVADAGLIAFPTVGGLPDSAFENDGQLTKRDARASALSRLAPMPGQLLWDVGAGAGSVAVEWARTDPTCRAIAIEKDPDRAFRVGRNAAQLGVPSVQVVVGPAPAALSGLEAPDAIFVGGGASAGDLFEICWMALKTGGRLVAHAVTLETEALLVQGCRRHGGELTRLTVERAEALGTFTGWKPQRALVQWSVQK